MPEPTTRALYTSSDNTIGKLFSREKTIICLVHNIPFYIKEKYTGSGIDPIIVIKK
jgi:hypothetical protein